MSDAVALESLTANLADNIRYIRERRNLTQSKLAKLIWDYPKGGSRYFDLVLNPAEDREGRSIPEDSRAREVLETFIRDLARRPSRRTTRPLKQPMSEQELEQFRALGYIE